MKARFFFKNCVVMGKLHVRRFSKIDLPFDERTSGSSDRSIYRSFKRATCPRTMARYFVRSDAGRSWKIRY